MPNGSKKSFSERVSYHVQMHCANVLRVQDGYTSCEIAAPITALDNVAIFVAQYVVHELMKHLGMLLVLEAGFVWIAGEAISRQA